MGNLEKVILETHKALRDCQHTHVSVPTKPVPASRPRVSKWGTYYGKNYTAFRKEAEKMLADANESSSAPLAVVTEIVVEKPKTSKRSYPRGDNDNYEKAIWDSITQCPGIWEDDDQIILNTTIKRFALKDEHPGFYLTIYKLKE